jgi:hypothetical protein
LAVSRFANCSAIRPQLNLLCVRSTLNTHTLQSHLLFQHNVSNDLNRINPATQNMAHLFTALTSAKIFDPHIAHIEDDFIDRLHYQVCVRADGTAGV